MTEDYDQHNVSEAVTCEKDCDLLALGLITGLAFM